MVWDVEVRVWDEGLRVKDVMIRVHELQAIRFLFCLFGSGTRVSD